MDITSPLSSILRQNKQNDNSYTGESEICSFQLSDYGCTVKNIAYYFTVKAFTQCHLVLIESLNVYPFIANVSDTIP